MLKVVRLLNTVTPDTLKIGNCISRTFLATEMSLPAPIIIEPAGAHKASVIFLHGLGDTGHGWSDVMRGELHIDHVKFICPTAPSIPVTINMGMRMPAWYDITSLSEFDREDEPGIKRSVGYVHTLISEEEARGIPASKIFVGGFSQGGAVALYAGLSYKNKLGGLLGLSCYLPLNKEFPAAAPVNSDIPIIMGHGLADPVVNYRFGEMSYEFIKKFNSRNIELKSYPGMGHSSCPQELDDVKRFLTKHLGDLS